MNLLPIHLGSPPHQTVVHHVCPLLLIVFHLHLWTIRLFVQLPMIIIHEHLGTIQLLIQLQTIVIHVHFGTIGLLTVPSVHPQVHTRTRVYCVSRVSHTCVAHESHACRARVQLALDMSSVSSVTQISIYGIATDN